MSEIEALRNRVAELERELKRNSENAEIGRLISDFLIRNQHKKIELQSVFFEDMRLRWWKNVDGVGGDYYDSLLEALQSTSPCQ